MIELHEKPTPSGSGEVGVDIEAKLCKMEIASNDPAKFCDQYHEF
jgi:hypothetical protein